MDSEPFSASYSLFDDGHRLVAWDAGFEAELSARGALRVGLSPNEIAAATGCTPHALTLPGSESDAGRGAPVSSYLRNGQPVSVTWTLLNDGHRIRVASRLIRPSTDPSEARYRRLFETLPIPLCVYEPRTLAFLEVNEAFVGTYGYGREELAALTVADIRYPRDEAGLREDISRARAGAVHGISLYADRRNQKKDGTIMTVEVRALDFDFDGKPARLALFIDMTERERAQEALRATELQLRQAQKMEAVGRLAGGVAHDFNNVLTVILGYAELVLVELEPEEPKRDPVEQIRKAGQRAAELTRQLLTFSRQQVIEPKVLDLNDVLASTDGMLRRLIGEDVELVLATAASLGHVRVDPGSIEQVIVNLVVNARDAMPTGGTITIETADAILDDAYARRHLGVKAGPHVLLAVSDTGTGMDVATQAHIFEPFFTTKEKGKGTGLGLATVFGIVQRSGGSIWAHSELGKGTRFEVYLPVVEAVADAAESLIAPTTLRGSETILLVEDEEQVRAVACDILKRQGYRIIEAQNAGEGLALCEKHAGAIDLLLSDVVMPQMSGPELARRLGGARPSMKILWMSGYTDETVVRHGALEGGIAFIQKPFTPDTLTRKVREVLDSERFSRASIASEGG